MSKTLTASSKLTEDDKNAICSAYPASGNACKETKDCPGGLACLNGKCAFCKKDSDCGQRSTCVDGTCVASCESNKDCVGGKVCRDKKCQGCLGDAECGADAYCDQDVCAPKCKSADDCETGFECKSDGRCVRPGGCKTHRHCPDGFYCQSEKCVDASKLGKECQGEGDCNQGEICLSDKGKSFCSTWCVKQGDPCVKGFVCKPFDEDRKFCAIAPKAAKEKNGADGGEMTDGGEEQGGGCSTTSMPLGSGLVFWLFAIFFLFGWQSKRSSR